MSIDIVVQKLVTYWYVIIIGAILFGVGFIPWSRSTTYQASIGYGIAFDNISEDASALQSTGSSNVLSTYAFILEEISKYLFARFASIETQTFIDSEMGLSHGQYSSTKPFYDVVNQSAGFVSLSYQAGTREEAEKFIEASNKAYINIVDEWNQNRPELFQTTPSQSRTFAIAEVPLQRQLQFIPVFVGLFVATAIVLVLPLKKNKAQTKSSTKK